MKVRHLVFKDDSFRFYLWSPVSGSVSSTGDEMTMSNPSEAIRNIYPIVNISNGCNLLVKAYAQNSSGVLNVTFYNSTSGSSSYVFLVNSNTYQVYVTSVLGNSVNSCDSVSITCEGDTVVIDFIAVSYSINGLEDYTDNGGDALTATINKKTIPITIPNGLDVVQQLGNSSQSHLLNLPACPFANYIWYRTLLENNSPVEFDNPINAATGFLVDVNCSSQGGYVSSLIAGNSPAFTIYNIQLTLIKADYEIDSIITA